MPAIGTVPYITPNLLKQADTGIDWDTIVQGDSADDVTNAEQWNICWRSSEMADMWCGQVLRATSDSEQIDGPGERVFVMKTGVTRIMLARWPVITVQQLQVSPMVFPLNFTTLASTMYFVRNASTDTVSAAGAYNVDIAPGFVQWDKGRYGYVLKIQYINGWAHSALNAPVAQNATSISVQDITGFVAGLSFTIYDGARTEVCQVASTMVAGSGPGAVPLTNPTVFQHPQQPQYGSNYGATLCTNLPAVIQQACIYFAVHIALTRGATAISLPPVSGLQASSSGSRGGASGAADPLVDEGKKLLLPFKRIL